MTIVMLAGGIDLSVGSTFALSNFVTLALFNWQGWPIGRRHFLRTAVGRPGRAAQWLASRLSEVARVPDHARHADHRPRHRRHAGAQILDEGRRSRRRTPGLWDFVGDGDVYGVPVAFIAAILVAVVGHIFLTRLRPGWHILAVGGSRRSAHNAGISVRRTRGHDLCHVRRSGCRRRACSTRPASARRAADTGVGLEVTALTAAVLGGNSLGGGRGSVDQGAAGRAHRH